MGDVLRDEGHELVARHLHFPRSPLRSHFGGVSLHGQPQSRLHLGSLERPLPTLLLDPLLCHDSK